jgi:hypothetical protein
LLLFFQKKKMLLFLKKKKQKDFYFLSASADGVGLWGNIGPGFGRSWPPARFTLQQIRITGSSATSSISSFAGGIRIGAVQRKLRYLAVFSTSYCGIQQK